MAWGVHAIWNRILILIQLLPSPVNLDKSHLFFSPLNFSFFTCIMKSNEEIDIKAIEMSLTHFENIFLKIVEHQAMGAHFVPSVGRGV